MPWKAILQCHLGHKGQQNQCILLFFYILHPSTHPGKSSQVKRYERKVKAGMELAKWDQQMGLTFIFSTVFSGNFCETWKA